MLKRAKPRWPRQDGDSLISWRGKGIPQVSISVPLHLNDKFSSHLYVLIPRLFRTLFLPGGLEEGKGHHALMAVSRGWVNTATPFLQRARNTIFGWVFFTWLVPIYLSQNPHLILSLVMFPYMAWTGELCFNEYKFAACSWNSCCFSRGQLRSSVSWGTCSTLIQTELISSPTLCSGKGKWS